MIKAKAWSGKDLKGSWVITRKIDGVRAFYTCKGGWVSRNGKPLYNISTVFRGDGNPEGYEVYCGRPGKTSVENYVETIKSVRAKTKDRPTKQCDLYTLDPLDARLYVGVVDDPTADFIRETLSITVASGYEGLVLRQGDKWIKVKPEETYDVPIVAMIEGEGKHEGRLGAIMTPMGKVGTGFSDFEREALWSDRQDHIGVNIEVSCMQLTADKKFRHPRFIRVRYDK